MHSFWCVLSIEPINLWLSWGKCSGFNGFQEQKTEAQLGLFRYKFTRPWQKICSQTYTCESRGCLENRVKEHSSHVASAIYIHSVSNNYPSANISHFKVIDQDIEQFPREDREAIHIRINNPSLNWNTGKIYIPEFFNSLLGADRSSDGSVQIADQTSHRVIQILIFQVIGFPEQCVWQIK